MLTKEILQKIRRIQIITSRIVTDAFAGQYHSVFKGQGIEFEEVREYQIGDEIRSIDWNVTARMGHPYVKKFIEERELTIMLLLDVSSSCYFGTVKQLKNQLAVEICSVLAFSAIQNNDKIGLIIFTDIIEKFVPPHKGLRHVLRVIREALCIQPKSKNTNIPQALEYLNKVTTRKTITFIISDFYAENFKKPLTIANKRHDIIAITLTDPVELNLPQIGILKLEDPETGKSFLIDTSNSKFKEFYNKNAQEKFEERKKIFQSINIDHVDIYTHIPYISTLVKFFKTRERRKQIR